MTIGGFRRRDDPRYAIPSNFPVLSPKRSAGAPTRSSIEQKRLFSGVCSGGLDVAARA